jgi:ribosomal protein S18 acetylase RimI-like enzyme
VDAHRALEVGLANRVSAQVDTITAMPLVTDLHRIRTALDRDRTWSAYAIGDLDPERLPDCSWYAPDRDPETLVLLYRAFTPPILFACGTPVRLSPLFAELDAPVVSLHLLPDAIAALPPAYTATETKAMWRMTVGPASFRRADGDETVAALDASHAEAVAALFADARDGGEAPPFYRPSMLAEGAFRGVFEGAALVAVAGTHLFSAALGVCTIGNVYTRRDRRRRGLAARVTSAVVRAAMAASIPTIVLNVSQANGAARRVYEQLGFDAHCAFVEGTARRLVTAQPGTP